MENNHIQPTFLGRFPLRLVLIVPFIVIIVCAVGLTGYLSFQNGQRAVNDVATQLRQEITHRNRPTFENLSGNTPSHQPTQFGRN